ncbi:DUF2631 domain-containing protein [Jatrophihabitans sp. YIM 134969]
MAIVPKPGSELDAHEGQPADYVHDHPTETPEDWGWHGEWGKYARIGGWVSAIILILMATATHYNKAGQVALFAFAALLVVALIRDAVVRRTSWRR